MINECHMNRRGVGGVNCGYYHDECAICGWNPVVERKRRKMIRSLDRTALAELFMLRASQYREAAKRMNH